MVTKRAMSVVTKGAIEWPNKSQAAKAWKRASSSFGSGIWARFVIDDLSVEFPASRARRREDSRVKLSPHRGSPSL